jgi:hypothetical protein
MPRAKNIRPAPINDQQSPETTIRNPHNTTPTIIKKGIAMNVIMLTMLFILLVLQSVVVFANRKRSMRNREILEQLEERVKFLETQSQ